MDRHLLDLRLLGRKKLSRITQTAIAECGLACLAMIANFHGFKVDIATMRRKFRPSSRGLTLHSLIKIADQMGFSSRAVQLDLDGLSFLHVPAILHWDMAHFVVIEAVRGGKALIHDPGGTSTWMPIGKVSKHFTGVALELQPVKHFEKGDYQKQLKLRDLYSHTRGIVGSLTQVIVLTAILQLVTLSFPYFIQLSLDLVLAGGQGDVMLPLLALYVLLALIGAMVMYLRSMALLSMGSLFGANLSSNVSRKLFRLPIDWFYRRHIGDILSRFQSVNPIRKLLAEDAPTVFVDSVLAVLTLIILFIYSPALAIISLSSVTISVLIRALIHNPQRQQQEDMLIANGREQSILIETLRGIRSLRLAGQESVRHALWRARMIEAVNWTVKSNRFDNFKASMQTTSVTIESFISIAVAVMYVSNGRFTIGMMMAFLAYKTVFMTSSSTLMEKFFEFKMLRLHLDRLADVVFNDDDVSFRERSYNDTQLKGGLELRNVSYRYGLTDPYVLNQINMSIKPGESVAIIGPSGGGKSTLVHILLGLYEPDDGDIMVDGLRIEAFGRHNYFRQVGSVLQDDTLFAGSISDNISMFDSDVNLEMLIEAASAASILDDIQSMPMGFDTLVGDMGNALSGGQQQRVILARAFYRRPKLLILDEATSHLDEKTEAQVNKYIKDIGITRIIIAHRRETILSADRVLLLERGRIEAVS